MSSRINANQRMCLIIVLDVLFGVIMTVNIKNPIERRKSPKKSPVDGT